MTTTERDEAARAWAETPRHSRRDAAEDRGWEPHRDDNAPLATHLVLPDDDPWMVALRASRAELREMGAA